MKIDMQYYHSMYCKKKYVHIECNVNFLVYNVTGFQAGLLFFIAVFWGFFPVFTAIFMFPQERAMLNKERAADMYRLSAYFLARTTSDLPLDLLLPSLFLLVVYFMAGLKHSVEAFFLTMLTVFLCIVAAQVSLYFLYPNTNNLQHY